MLEETNLALTCAKNEEKGRPLSRENAQVVREAAARFAHVEVTADTMIPEIIKDVARLDPVAPYTISMIGKPVLEPSAA